MVNSSYRYSDRQIQAVERREHWKAMEVGRHMDIAAKTLPVAAEDAIPPSPLDPSNCSPPTRSISVSSRSSLEGTSSPLSSKKSGAAFRQLPHDIIEL